MQKRKLVILGAGESGVGAALLAVKKNFDVWISDYSNIKEKYKEELIKHKISFEEGGHNFEKVLEADLIIKSPGISNTVEIIKSIREQGIEIISEIEFGYRMADCRIIAITGSNGKTTVSSLIFHLLKESNKKVILGGNIGTSFSRLLAGEHDFEIAVLELSSFQLDDVRRFKPDVAVILNITPDHLDRYDYKIENYARSKWNICSNQKGDDILILNEDDYWIKQMNIRVGSSSRVVWLSANNPAVSFNSKEIKHNLKGKHNDFNVSVAMKAVSQFVNQDDLILKALLDFKAIEHRIETVAFINGVEYINDSKATNVEAVNYALAAMDKSVIWIAGGTDKGNDYNQIIDVVKDKVKALVCLGVDNTKLLKAFEGMVDPVLSTDNMEDAIRKSFDMAERGDVVLLSPACASFDLFENYEHRGQMFKKEVFKLIN